MKSIVDYRWPRARSGTHIRCGSLMVMPLFRYSKQKAEIELMFWSGADFDEPEFDVVGKKLEDASAFFNDLTDVKKTTLRRWLKRSRSIQWDYKNIVKRKGQLVRLQTKSI